MSMKTEIQWASSTVNPSTGCDGCEIWKAGIGGPCYAGNYHETRMAKALPALYAPNFDEVRLVPGRMAKAAAWSDLRGKPKPDAPWLPAAYPRLIFVGDMADLFSKAVPFEYIRDEVIATALSTKGQRHAWMLLTKQPRRMVAFGGWLAEQGIVWPDNLWAGTSITSNVTAKRAEFLKQVPARVRYLSLEPLWEYVDLSPVLDSISWVIIGGQSDQGEHEAKPFDVEWARAILRDCNRTGAAAFVKQFGSRPYDSTRRISIDGPDSHAVELSLKDHHGGDWSEWSEDLRVRQFPTIIGDPS